MRREQLILSFILPLILLLGMISCQSSSWKRMELENGYHFMVPPNLKPTQRLNPSAYVQLQDKQKDVYLLLHLNSWDSLMNLHPQNDLSDYFDTQLEAMISQLEKPKVEDPDSVRIDKLEGLKVVLKGEYKGNPLIYQLSLFQDSLYLFHLLQWMPEAEWVQQQAKMDSILNSFSK